MSVRRLTLLAALLLAAGLYYYLVEVRGAEERSTREAEAKQLFHFQADDATQLTLRRDDETLALTKRDGVWHLTAPVTERADGVTVSGILRNLATLTPERALADPEDLAEYGLDSPSLVVEVKSESGDLLAELHGGDENPDGSRRFVRVADGTTVGLVSTFTYGNVAKSLFDLRSKQWTTHAMADVTEAEFRAAEGAPVRIVRDPEKPDSWQVAGESPKTADASSIRSLLGRLMNARIAEVVVERTDTPGLYGLDSPAYLAALRVGDAEVTLRIGNEVPESSPSKRYAQAEGDARVLVFDSAITNEFPAAPEDLRERKVLQFTENTIGRIELANDGNVLTLRRLQPDSDAWIIEGDESVPADSSRVRALLSGARRLEVERFLGLGEEYVTPADFAAAPVAVRLWAGDEDVPLEVRFAKGEASGAWYVQRTGDAEVLQVANNAPDPFRLDRDALLDRTLLRFDAESIQRVTIQTATAEMAYERRSDNTWKASPTAPAVDALEFEQLLLDLGELAYIQRLPPDHPALAADPTLSLTLIDAGGTTIATVRIAGRVDVENHAAAYATEAAGATVAIDGRLVSDWLPVFQGP